MLAAINAMLVGMTAAILGRTTSRVVSGRHRETRRPKRQEIAKAPSGQETELASK